MLTFHWGIVSVPQGRSIDAVSPKRVDDLLEFLAGAAALGYIISEWLVEDQDQPRDGCYRDIPEEIAQMLSEAAFDKVVLIQIDTDIVFSMAVEQGL